MERLFKHWWNGRWGRLGRRDIKVYRDGNTYRIEDCVGGVEGRAARYERLTGPEAVKITTDLMGAPAEWTDMMAVR